MLEAEARQASNRTSCAHSVMVLDNAPEANAPSVAVRPRTREANMRKRRDHPPTGTMATRRLLALPGGKAVEQRYERQVEKTDFVPELQPV